MLKRVKFEKLSKVLNKLLNHYGLSKKNSNRVSSLLINANLSGQDSHGVSRLPMYLEKIKMISRI